MSLQKDSLRPDQVRRNFSRHAAEYERYARVQKTVASNLMKRLELSPASGRVLEVGCGTGILSRLFRREYPGLKLFLSDVAHGMSRQAAEEFPQLAVADADALALPFAANSFDLVLSSSVYQWVDHLPSAFEELWRVLRPGGRIALALFGERTLYELRDSHAAALSGGTSHGQGFPDCRQIQVAIGDHFQIEQLESEEELEWHPDVPGLMRALKGIGAQNASRQRPAGLASKEMMQRMFACYERRFRRDGMIPATYEVIYVLARKR